MNIHTALGEKLVQHKEKVERLNTILRQINPKLFTQERGAILESMTSSNAGATLGLESVTLSAEHEISEESLDLLSTGQLENIGPDNAFALEAIVMPFHRPVIDIVDNKMVVSQVTKTWQHLNATDRRSKIEETFSSIGRLDVPGHPSLPYAGTGVIVGRVPGDRAVIMTNRHVAQIFATGLGRKQLSFDASLMPGIDFRQEIGGDRGPKIYSVEKILMIHPFWDMALIEVGGVEDTRIALPISTANINDMNEDEVVTIGYPGYTPGGDNEFQNVQNRIFRNTYYVKRLQPGLLRKRESVKSYEKAVPAVTHDCSTLGGNSGSAVLRLPTETNENLHIIALHFAGAYLRANYAVPMYDLFADQRVADIFNTFTDIDVSAPMDPSYVPFWRNADPNIEESTEPQSVNYTDGSSGPSTTAIVDEYDYEDLAVKMRIPIEISVKIGSPVIKDGSRKLAQGRSGENAPSTMLAPDLSDATFREGLFGKRDNDEKFRSSASLFKTVHLRADGFSWNAALSTAVASKIAYAEDSLVQSIALNDWGFHQCEFVEKEETQCFIASSNGLSIVAFRGTESLGDWLGNLRVFSIDMPYGKVHRGFVSAFHVVKDEVAQILNASRPQKIIVTGHSLGGALATIAAAEWVNVAPVSAVFTFGQPTTGDEKLQSVIGSVYPDNFFRFVNNQDVVPCVPPGYRHVGKRFHFDDRGGLKTNTESISLMNEQEGILSEQEFTQLRAQILGEKNAHLENLPSANPANIAVQNEGLISGVRDHSIDRYIENIRAMTGIA